MPHGPLFRFRRSGSPVALKSLALGAPQVVLEDTFLPLSGISVPLNPAAAAGSGTLTLSAATGVPLSTASGTGGGALLLSAPTVVLLDPASGGGGGSLEVGIPGPVAIPLDPASGQSSATANIQAVNVYPDPSGGISSATLFLTVPTRLILGPASGVSVGSIIAYAPFLIFPEGIESETDFGVPSFGLPPPEPRTEGTVDDVGALAIARRSFPEAQRRLPRVPVRTVLLAGRVGWFADDAETGAVAIAGVDGPLAPYAGYVVRIIYRKRSIYAYVMRANGTPEDLDLSRRAFMALAYPSDQIIHAVIEVVG